MMFINETPESLAQSLYDVISNTNTTNSDNNWTLSNSLVIKLQKCIQKYQDSELNIKNEVFTSNFFRLMKDPVKGLVSIIFSLLSLIISFYSSFTFTFYFSFLFSFLSIF